MMSSKNIYITFPNYEPGDDAPFVMWKDRLIKNLEIALPRILKDKQQFVVKGIGFDHANFVPSILKSDIFVLLFDGKPLDEIYIKELDQVCKHLNIGERDNLEGLAKVFKIAYSPLEDGHQPNCMMPIKSYDFFDKSHFRRKAKSFSFEEETKTLAWSKLLDISYDIKEILCNSETTSLNAGNKLVYLAECTSDQAANRDEVVRELQHFGYRTIPFIKLPDDAEEQKQAIQENLAHTQIVLQILGNQYGELVKKSKYSFVDFQNQVIREYQQEHPEQEIKRIIWIPTGMKVTDQRQNLYLKRLKRDDSGEHTEIIEAPLEAFKTLLSERLLSSHEPEQTLNGEDKLYFICEEKDQNTISLLERPAQELGYKLCKIDFAKDKELYTSHLHYLKEADRVVIYASNSDSYWIKSKIRDLIKAPGLGRNKKFKSISVITDKVFKVKSGDLIDTPIEIIPEETEKAISEHLKKFTR